MSEVLGGGAAAQVAQISNLLYRRASSLQVFRVFKLVRTVENTADWKSAIQQVGNLRYRYKIGH